MANPQTVTILFIVFLAVLSQSTFGFGLALFSMPLLAFTLEIRSATPLVAMVGTTVVLGILLKDWRDVNMKAAWRLIISSAAGIPIGLFLLKGMYDELLKILLASLIILFSAYSLFSPGSISIKTDRSSYIFGFFAGMLGGAYNTGGPPVIIYGNLRHWTPSVFRATLQSFFLLNCIIIMTGHYATGLWTPLVVKLYLACFPVILLGTLLGTLLNRKIQKGAFDKIIHIVLLCIGVLLLVHTLL